MTEFNRAARTALAMLVLVFCLVPPAHAGPGKPFHALIARYAAAEGVPVALAHAIVRHESNYRPNARGRAGEIGLMQIKLKTARGMGYSGSAAELFDPATNLKWGMRYLGRAHDLGGGETIAFRARLASPPGSASAVRVVFAEAKTDKMTP